MTSVIDSGVKLSPMILIFYVTDWRVSAHWTGSGLVGMPHVYNSMLVNGGCTNEQGNKDKGKKNKHLIYASYSVIYKKTSKLLESWSPGSM